MDLYCTVILKGRTAEYPNLPQYEVGRTHLSSFPKPAKLQKQNTLGGQYSPKVFYFSPSSLPVLILLTGKCALTLRPPVAQLLIREFFPTS